MSALSNFSEDEIELLASVPYKAGAWISHADDEEGEDDDERELKALESIIKEIATFLFD